MLKAISKSFIFIFLVSSSVVAVAQSSMDKMAHSSVNKINLEQTTGEFTIKGLTLTPGDYQFEIANNGVDHEVGFVLAPKGKTDQANHIKEAYVKAPVATGKSSMTNVVSLEAGEYVYFCPLNPTEQYTLNVKEEITTVELIQTTGAFSTKNLTLSPGKYQFNIANDGVDHEVGFVLVPKGKSAQEDHIKEAYVKAPVPTGKSSMTNVVTLEKGEYEYFCPLNPTGKYSLSVK